MRCSNCSDSCGDDKKTKSKYREEKSLGDRLNVILGQVYDMCGSFTKLPKTRSDYKREKNNGDRWKLILLNVYDMQDVDNLQIYEIKTLFTSLVDVNIDDADLVTPKKRTPHDGLRKDYIKALFYALVDEHIFEIDLLSEKEMEK